VTLKAGVLMLKIQLCITGINYILKYIQVEKYTVYYFNCGKHAAMIRDFKKLTKRIKMH